jgi:hypothetical protein
MTVWTDCPRCKHNTRFEHAPGRFDCVGCGYDDRPATAPLSPPPLSPPPPPDFYEEDEADDPIFWA